MLSFRADALEPYLEKCNFPPAETPVSCAVSGGADSVALTLLAKAQGCEVQVIHINHQLRPDSGKDGEWIASFAESLEVKFQCFAVEVKEGGNLEANARAARYEALNSVAPDILLGHTADDQAETLLLNLLWGSGPEGLAGMRYDHRRPILKLRRYETEEICRACGVTPLEDPTNTDPRFRRNRIRREVIPLLNDIAEKDIVPVLNRTAGISREISELLDELTEGIDPTDAKALQKLHPQLAAWVLRRWLAEKIYPDRPDAAAIQRVLAIVNGEILATEIPGGHRVSRTAMRLVVT